MSTDDGQESIEGKVESDTAEKLFEKADAAAENASAETVSALRAVSSQGADFEALERYLTEYFRIYARAYSEKRFPNREEYDRIGELGGHLTRNVGALLVWEDPEIAQAVGQRRRLLTQKIKGYERKFAEEFKHSKRPEGWE